MKFKMNRALARACLLSGTFLFSFTLVYAARSTWYRRDTTTINGQIHLLENDGTTTQKGATKFGSDETTPAIPTTSNAASFGIKIPFYNAGPGSTAIGSVIISTGVTPFYGGMTTSLATTTVVGVSDGVYAVGVVGYMSIGGYALVLTTGPVSKGDVLVTTGTVQGYAGAANDTLFTSSATIVGAVIGTAVQRGTASGGLTAVRMK